MQQCPVLHGTKPAVFVRIIFVSEDCGDTWKAVPVGGRFFLAKLLTVNKSLWADGQSVVLKQADGLKWSRITSLTPSGAVPKSNVTTTRPATQ